MYLQQQVLPRHSHHCSTSRPHSQRCTLSSASSAAAATATVWSKLRHLRNSNSLSVQAAAAASSTAQPTAVITGCSTGIGRESALLLAQQGWRVFAGARAPSNLQQLAQLHGGISPVHIDVTSQDSIAAAAEQVRAAVGSSGLQLLVNNAGIGMVAPVECFPINDFRQVMEVNLFGAVQTSQAFIPLLRQGPQKGRIINVSSVCGHFALPLWSAYVSSKHALEGFSDCLRYELAPHGVAVVLIKPGPVKTPIWAKSRAKSEGLNADMSAAMTELYGPVMKGISEEVRKSEEAGLPVEAVAQLVYEAATTPQPKVRYHIGDTAGLTYWAKRLLPDDIWEAVLTKNFQGMYDRATAQQRQQQ